jgi:signal transduction histidine kinase
MALRRSAVTVGWEEIALRSLQLKLTLSYTLITIATLMTLVLSGVIVAGEVVTARLPDLLVQTLGQRAAEALPYLATTPPDADGASEWLRRNGDTVLDAEVTRAPHLAFSLSSPGGLFAVVDRRGMVVASRGGRLPDAARPAVRGAVAGRPGTVYLADGSLAGAAPVRDQKGLVVGALVTVVRGIDQPGLLAQALLFTAVLALPLAPLAAIVGTIFGFVVARGFTRRYRRVSLAVARWTEGDLAVTAAEGSRDELGHLIGRLNRMAAQIRDLLDTRQRLGVIEERQRLARDLHDSLKQQVFAISMLLNSSRELLPADPNAASARLAEVDSLVADVQRELGALLQALRPLELDGRPLGAALQRLAERWSAQTGIAAAVRVDGEPGCPPKVEEALFRVAQEALSNVARHSSAGAVELRLVGDREGVMLTVADDGVGLDREAGGAGLGLRSMQERMQAAGGTLRAGGVEGRGATITACWRVLTEETGAWSR